MTMPVAMLVFSVGLFSCGGKKNVPDIQKQVQQLQIQLGDLQKQLQVSTKQLEELKASAAKEPIDKPMEDQTGQVKELDLATASAAPTPAAAEPAPHVAAPSPTSTPHPATSPAGDRYEGRQPTRMAKPASINMAGQEKFYNEAFILYEKKEYPQAIARFEEFILRFPTSALADNAQYWIGECNLDMNRPADALDAFQKLMIRYPSGNKMPDAYLKSGITYVRLHDLPKAAAAFKKVVESYPESEAALVAKDQLARMEEK